ncbi:lig_chan-Glu_bd domain-containing protein [Caerostris darwini]|uniref:Lig_chan-Glu_bd domain-containing protein n=1 Tax=Caerostris darwini TaxID=1538125 RepID=A0AAV4QTU3_9ARAC|nr:lig_chan-Glu_bd domain-containing protein [Caerostris darwini]
MKFPSFMKIAVLNLLGVCHLKTDYKGEIYLADGVEAEFLQILSETLKFRYKLIIPPDGQWGKKMANGTWTGMTGLLVRGEADMAMCQVIISEDRKTAIDYSYAYEIVKLVFANKKPGLLPKPFAILYPFSLGVWVSIMVLIMVMPFIWKFLFSIKFSGLKLLGNVFLTLLSGSASIRIVAFRDYVLWGTWIAAISFLSRSYTAVLLSFLTLPLQESIIRDYDQLARAISVGNYRSLSFKGAIIGDMMESSSITSVQLIVSAMNKNEWFVKPSLEDVGKALAERNTAVIAMKPFLADHFADQVAISYDYFSVVQFGLALKKHFCCKDILDTKLSYIMAAGLFENYKRNYRHRFRLKLKDDNTEELEFIAPLSMQNIIGALLIYLIGSCLAVVTFMFEIFYKKWKFLANKFF